LMQNLLRTMGARQRIHAAGVRDDLQLRLLLQRWRQALQYIEEIARVARIGIALLLPGKDRHRQLSEIFQREVVELPALGQANRRVQAIAPEAATIADADGFHEEPTKPRESACLIPGLSPTPPFFSFDSIPTPNE